MPRTKAHMCESTFGCFCLRCCFVLRYVRHSESKFIYCSHVGTQNFGSQHSLVLTCPPGKQTRSTTEIGAGMVLNTAVALGSTDTPRNYFVQIWGGWHGGRGTMHKAMPKSRMLSNMPRFRGKVSSRHSSTSCFWKRCPSGSRTPKTSQVVASM